MSETVDLYDIFRPNDSARDRRDDLAAGNPAPAAPAPAPRMVDVNLRVRLPAATPFTDVTAALAVMEAIFGGTWAYVIGPDQPRGRFELEARP